MCFGLYELPSSSSDIAGKLKSFYLFTTHDSPSDDNVGRTNPKQIGLARLISDEVTFAYLTDVYVLPEYQGKGLGKWMIECINETLESWPEFRRAFLVTKEDSTFYAETLGMKKYEQGYNGVAIFMKRGPASRV